MITDVFGEPGTRMMAGYFRSRFLFGHDSDFLLDHVVNRLFLYSRRLSHDSPLSFRFLQLFLCGSGLRRHIICCRFDLFRDITSLLIIFCKAVCKQARDYKQLASIFYRGEYPWAWKALLI